MYYNYIIRYLLTIYLFIQKIYNFIIVRIIPYNVSNVIDDRVRSCMLRFYILYLFPFTRYIIKINKFRVEYNNKYYIFDTIEQFDNSIVNIHLSKYKMQLSKIMNIKIHNINTEKKYNLEDYYKYDNKITLQDIIMFSDLKLDNNQHNIIISLINVVKTFSIDKVYNMSILDIGNIQ